MQTVEDASEPGFPRATPLPAYTIPEELPFDEAGGGYFRRRIRQSRVYVEYGSGAATIHAAGHTQLLCSIDSDAWYLNAVRRKLAEQPRTATCHLLHADIERAPHWAGRATRDPLGDVPQGWRRYAWSPWQCLWKQGAMADTILVDGRFRVACALATLIHLPADSEAELLVDDYADRPYYHVLEACGTLAAMHGRMAVFRADHTRSLASLDGVLRRYEGDWR